MTNKIKFEQKKSSLKKKFEHLVGVAHADSTPVVKIQGDTFPSSKKGKARRNVLSIVVNLY